jgi:hypothetical protein
MSTRHFRAANTASTFGREAAPVSDRLRQCARRLMLVAMLSLAAAMLTAASAVADPINKIEINGAAPNADGSGLQVTATWRNGGPQYLKVTNNSSSYTDIKEIDGAANPTPDPITDAKRQDSQQPCTVDRTGGGSFSCQGLSIAPGQSVGIFLSSGGPFAQPTAGLAFINVIYDTIEVNGLPMNPHGKGLQVSAITTKGSCPELPATAWCFTLVNSPSSGAPMMLVTITPNSPPSGDPGGRIADIHGEFGFGSADGGCTSGSNSAFDCIVPFAVSPQKYGIDFTSSFFTSGIGDIAVRFVSTPCANSAGVGSPFARVADNCTPPSHTKITQASVNHQKHTAFFRFTAKGTKKFVCELIHNGHRMLYRSCTSPKPYASPLPKGQYIFIVDGTNQGGVDPKPARFTFSL